MRATARMRAACDGVGEGDARRAAHDGGGELGGGELDAGARGRGDRELGAPVCVWFVWCVWPAGVCGLN